MLSVKSCENKKKIIITVNWRYKKNFYICNGFKETGKLLQTRIKSSLGKKSTPSKYNILVILKDAVELTKYRNPSIKISRLWNMKMGWLPYTNHYTKLIPKTFNKHMQIFFDCDYITQHVQNIALIKTAFTVKKVRSI